MKTAEAVTVFANDEGHGPSTLLNNACHCALRIFNGSKVGNSGFCGMGHQQRIGALNKTPQLRSRSFAHQPYLQLDVSLDKEHRGVAGNNPEIRTHNLNNENMVNARIGH